MREGRGGGQRLADRDRRRGQGANCYMFEPGRARDFCLRSQIGEDDVSVRFGTLADDDKHEEAYMDLKKSLSYDEAALAQLYADDEKSETEITQEIQRKQINLHATC